MNPHESKGGFMGENKSPWIPMTHESEYPCDDQLMSMHWYCHKDVDITIGHYIVTCQAHPGPALVKRVQ